MLELWRPPHDSGEPIGCLASTYTFAPELFDEQCLARFLEIESEPNREDLAFLLERESRLGSIYAGVLVDYTQAGVEHSLRWYVLPVRIPNGKQHAKLSLLAWTRHIRIVVASANLTEAGYRTNYEVAGAIDLGPESADVTTLNQAITFLRSLLQFVPGAAQRPREVIHAEEFLDQVVTHVAAWKPARHQGRVRQRLVFTLPSAGAGQAGRGSLDEAVRVFRKRGGSPIQARVASPFFDMNEDTSRVTASLCKLMARGGRRDLRFAVPAIRDGEPVAVPRLAAPIALLRTPPKYRGTVTVEILPDLDTDKNRRPWHAKMLGLATDGYVALMVGSSNFTRAGMGIGLSYNAEANLLTIVEHVDYGRVAGKLEAVWPEMESVNDPESAEWLGVQLENEGEEQTPESLLPEGFLAATYRAGDMRRIILRFAPGHLPEEWRIDACGQDAQELLSAAFWREGGCLPSVELVWTPVQPPEKLRIHWDGHVAFLPLNVEDARELPPPSQLEHMSADDMLWILSTADPSAAVRAWARRQQSSDILDSELDSAAPVDLDPLQRYDLQATFLHRIRQRARVLAQLRANLQKPVWGRQALDWRLRGLIGIAPLADRLVRDFVNADGRADEALLMLADFLIVLREVDYQPDDGCLPEPEFQKVFRPFLSELAERMERDLKPHRTRISADVMGFWTRVVEQCRK